jgi:hypothetical protein
MHSSRFETMFRRSTFLVLLPLLLAGCVSSSKLQSTLGNKYAYSVSMVEPVRSKEMLFRDKQIVIQFRVDDPGFRFQIQNITPADMKIDWAHATINVHGLPSPVRSASMLYDTTNAEPASQSVPSLGVVREAIIPRTSVYFDGTQWHIDDLLPTTDGNTHAMRSSISKLVGSSIDLTLPIDFGADAHSYRFTFSIDSVRQIQWSEHRAPGWIPPLPPIHRLKPNPEDNVAAIIIAGSFLGILRYMTSLKKTPVVE